MFWIKFIILLCLRAVATQSCDSSSDVTQCSVREICKNNRCEYDTFVYCGGDYNPCPGFPSFRGVICTSDYCQPTPCTSTGQCIHGQVCSQDTSRRCVYPVVINVEQGSKFTLAFKKPGTSGTYERIQWYKGGRYSVNRIAYIHPTITDNKVQYYNELCSVDSPCLTSDRADLNISTGELIIHKVEFSDEGFYYYYFKANGTSNTGYKYEYKLNVHVLRTLTIEGVPSEYVEVGTNLTLTCTVDKIRLMVQRMYWVVHGRNVTGTLSNTRPDVDAVFTQTTTYVHVVTKEDKSAPIRCVEVLVYGDTVEVEAVINPGYAPFGRPIIEVSGNDKYEGDNVTLICTHPMDKGNPPCNTYVWKRLEGNINYLPTTLIYTFIMDHLHAGNYTCQCSNEFGSSWDSDIKEITYLGKERPERPEPENVEQKGRIQTIAVNVGLIAGCVIGVLVLVGLVVAAVFFCKKYQFSIQKKSRNVTAADKVDQEMDGYEDPVNNNKNAEPPIPPAIPPPNDYHYIDAMDRAGDAGYMNPEMTTYEDIL